MTKIKLLALDLDGTLFTDKKEVTKENRDALVAAKEKSVHVVITTGRPLKAIEYLLEELDLMNAESYSVTFNGGLIQRNTGDVLSKTSFEKEDILAIYDSFEELGLPMQILADGEVYEINPYDEESLYRKVNPHLTFHDITRETLPDDISYNKALSAFHAEKLDAAIPHLPKELHDQFEIFKSRDIVLEVMPKGVHKANGLKALTEYLGIKQEEVMAMGDEENDLSMLEWAGLGVAMANGVAIAKETADAVTPVDNNHSGVAWAVNEFILKED